MKKTSKDLKLAGAYNLCGHRSVVVLPSEQAHREFFNKIFPDHETEFRPELLWPVTVIGDKQKKEIELVYNNVDYVVSSATVSRTDEHLTGKLNIVKPLPDIQPVPGLLR